MGKYLVRIFAVIGLILTLSIAIGAFSTWFWLTRPAPPAIAPAAMVLDLDFTAPIADQSRGFSLALDALLQEEPEVSLPAIIHAIDAARVDPRVKGIVAHFDAQQPKMAHAQEIRAALQRFADSKKFTYAYAPNYGDFGQGNRVYYLASAFENIWLQPVGTVGLSGVTMQAPFAKSALEKIGVSADFMRRDEYKSVMENVTRDDFSPDVFKNMDAMIKDLAAQQIEGIAASRKLDVAKTRALADNGPYIAQEALAAQLITKIGYEDEMLKEVREKAGAGVVRVDVFSYLSFADSAAEPKATIALINGLGMITDNLPKGPQRLAIEGIIDTDEVVAAFADAAADPEVRAILFRVDSPGGSPSASETIRHALIRAKESHKPIFVSMGDVAASGGYWISMNADHIVAQPATLTGSIGVVAGKFVLGGLWDKLGIKWQTLATGENPSMWSSLEPFSKHGRNRLNALLDDTYAAFIKNVAEARKIPLEKMPDIAKGRIWTGQQALKVGLVDELGGLQTTVAALKKELKLQPEDVVALKQFPPPETPTALAIKIMRNIGLESASLGEVASSWRRFQAAAAPWLQEIDASGAVMMRMPSAVTQMSR